MGQREPERTGLAPDDEGVSVVRNEDVPVRGELDEIPQEGGKGRRVGGLGELARHGLHVVGVALAGEGEEVGHAFRRFGLSLNLPLPVRTTSSSTFFASV